jgi:hypothetical protein
LESGALDFCWAAFNCFCSSLIFIKLTSNYLIQRSKRSILLP